MDKFDQIERVHLYACKRFLHVLDKTPNDIVYGELGRYPLWITSISKSIKYWFRLLKQPENFWSKKKKKKHTICHWGYMKRDM